MSSFTDGEGPAVKFDTADDVLYGASFLYVPDYFSHAYFRAFRARSIRLDHDIGEPHFEQSSQSRAVAARASCPSYREAAAAWSVSQSSRRVGMVRRNVTFPANVMFFPQTSVRVDSGNEPDEVPKNMCLSPSQGI